MIFASLEWFCSQVSFKASLDKIDLEGINIFFRFQFRIEFWAQYFIWQRNS